MKSRYLVFALLALFVINDTGLPLDAQCHQDIFLSYCLNSLLWSI